MKLIILIILLSGCRTESQESEPEVVVDMDCLRVNPTEQNDVIYYGKKLYRCTTVEAVCYVSYSGGISCIPKYNLNNLDKEQDGKY